MYFFEEYVSKRAKQGEVELDALSDWVKSLKQHLKRRIYCDNGNFSYTYQRTNLTKCEN